jgi:sugar lactone lactonase YvrE
MRIDNDRGLSDLLAEQQERVLCGGFRFTEGAVWVPAGGFLLFSDIPGNTIHRWTPGDREATPYRRPSGHTNGNTLDHQGRLISCEHSGRRVSIAPIGGEPVTLTDRFEGKRYNSPNDVVVHSSGAVYFTDPTYGITGTARGMGEPGAVQELPYQGVYRVAPDGGVRLLLDGFTQPNGLAFSADERVLYAGDSQEKIINRYEVQPDGSLTGESLFVDMRDDDRPGVPDGMKVDEAGRLWSTGAGGVWVAEPDGTVLGQFETDEHAANLCFGGPDFGTLYLCTRTTVSAIETRVRGIAPGSR